MDMATYILCKSSAKKYTDQVTQSLMGGVHYRGSVNYYANLPDDAQEGDSYTVKYAGTSGSIADGTEYTWGYDTDLEDYTWISFSKDAYTKTEVDAALSAKQNTISDLTTIRSGAALGATAVQPVSGKGLSTNDFTNAEKTKLDNHVIDTNNPHQVTKEQVGLGNVDNVATKDVLAELVDSGQKNHLLNGETSRTVNGVTFTIMSDKTVELSGTATNNITSFCLVTMQPAPVGIMVLSGCPSGGAYNKYKLDILNGGTSGNILAADYGNGVPIDWSLCTAGNYTARIRIESGQNVDGLIFKPMLCTKAAWDISQKYIPYRPSYDELVARIEALEQAVGINTRSVATLATESAADANDTEGGEVR